MTRTTRRDGLLAGGGGLLAAAGCGRERKSTLSGYRGFAFVANSAGKAVAAVDLNAFAVARHIALAADPVQMIDDPRRPFVYALTPASGEIVEISVGQLEAGRRARLDAVCDIAKISPDGRFLWALSRASRQLLRVPVDQFKPDLRIPLPDVPVDFDLGPDEDVSRGKLAVTVGGNRALLIDAAGKPQQTIALDGETGGVVFRKDGRQVMIANRGSRQLTLADVASGRVVASLPLAVRPDQLCAKADGGQVFITGEGADVVVTLYPFQAEVANTMLAGRNPGSMAVSSAWDYLLVANPSADNVTIVNIANQRVLAVAPVGKRPEFIAVTPDGNYALVINRESGDMAVLHLVIEHRRTRSAAIAARIPVGSSPVGAVVRAV